MTSACGRIGFDATTDSALPATRSELTLNAPGESLIDFPLLVILDDTRAARDRMQPDASDLRFFDAGGNVLAHEIEQLGVAGGAPLVAWVRVPLIDGPTTLAIEYGRPPPPPSPQSVWSDLYAAVFHLGDRVDSTSNKFLGGWAGPLQQETVESGRIANAHTFHPATGDAIVINDAPAFSFTNAITISAWMKPLSLAAGSGFNAAVTQEYMGAGEVFWLGLDDGQATAFAELGTTSGQNLGGGGGAVSLGSWMHVAMTYEGATERLYFNGAQAKITPVTGTLLPSTFPVIIGADANAGAGPDDDYFDGAIDEVRLEKTVRSANWIAYDVASMRDQVITYGPIAP